MRSPRTFIRNRESGFTLIEIVVVIALMSIVFTLALVVSPDIYRGNSFSSERDTVVSILQKARNESINNIDGTAHGVHFDPAPAPYVLFEGATYSSSSANNLKVPSSAAMSHTGMTEIIFAQLSGVPTTTGSTSFKLTDGTSLHTVYISTNSEGRIDW